MSVDTTHENYDKFIRSWRFVRDAIDGDSAIKAGGELYVPKLSGQTPEEYKAYIGRPYFEGYTQRVADGLTGLLFSKTPKVEAPKQLMELDKNFDLNGSTLTDYAQEIASEVLEVGRVGALVDMGRDENQNRPYATLYSTENIINWKHENINNQNTLTMVVLTETEKTWISQFDVENTTIYRVLLLNADKKSKIRKYEQHIYRPKQDDNNKVTSYDVEILIPLMNGKPLTYIPFVSITPEKLTIEPCKPPLIDVARVNVAHFKLNVDYYHGMHFTALPTPYGTGTRQGARGAGGQETPFHIGSTEFTWLLEPQAKLSFLEFEGKGLETLENEKSKLIDSMVVLGSNMLQGDKNTAEAENTVAMRSAGQNATLISTADTISRGITKVLEIMAEWMGVSGEISYKLNTDYNLTQMSSALLKELISGRTLGEIPRKVLFDTLKDGEIIKEDVTYEDYENMLQEEAPVVAISPIPPKANNDLDLEQFKRDVGAN